MKMVTSKAAQAYTKTDVLFIKNLESEKQREKFAGDFFFPATYKRAVEM